MKVSKAIEILIIENKHPWSHANSDLRAALKLGIEALKARRKDMKAGYIDADDLLPGETPEEEAGRSQP